jgi:hypothetical protein
VPSIKYLLCRTHRLKEALNSGCCLLVGGYKCFGDTNRSSLQERQRIRPINKFVIIRNVVIVGKRLRRTIKSGVSVTGFTAYGLSASWLLFSRLNTTYKSILTNNSLMYKTYGSVCLFIYLFRDRAEVSREKNKNPWKRPVRKLTESLPSDGNLLQLHIPASTSRGGGHKDRKKRLFLSFQNEQSRLKPSRIQQV